MQHHHYLILEHYHSKMKLLSSFSSHSPTPSPKPMKTENPLPDQMDLPTLDTSYKRSHKICVFHVWLLSLSILSWRFIHLIACISISLIFTAESYFTGCMIALTTFYLFINQLIDIVSVSSLGLLSIMLLWTFMHKFLREHTFSVLSGIDVGLELLLTWL